ncbi:MAG: EAL domain-containing protein [Porticoccaceae bacterium]|nr:EAL domain-containing protein [Porticoccaceae bacterium]
MPFFKHLNLDRLTFREQLFAMFWCVALFMAPITAYITSTTANDALTKQLFAQGEQISRTLAKQSKLALLYESEFTARETVNFVSGFSDIEVLELRLVDGRALYRSDSFDARELLLAQTSEQDLHSYEFDNEWVYVLSVMSDPGVDDTFDLSTIDKPDPQALLGYVTVAMSKQTLFILQRKTFVTNILLSLVMVVVTSILLVRIAKQITRPLESLAESMQLAEQGDKGVRAEEKGQPDVAKMQHAFNAMMDVLEKREQQLEFSRDNAIEHARVKGEFAANVTHELRTPMNAILGMLDLLAESQISNRQADYVSVAKNSAENLLILIDDILDFSKTDANKPIANKVDLYLTDVLEDVMKLLAAQALSKNVDIGYRVDAMLFAQVPLDRSRVQQILINLIGNAIKFTESGEVSATVSVRPDSKDGDHTDLLFEIKDSGIGISKDDQSKIFEAFTQADASTTREFAGTGLGLTISKQTVELMGGKIGVNSNSGRGSTFWFTLPLSYNPETRSETPNKCPSPNQRKVLLITNCLIIKEFSQQVLSLQNIICDVTHDYMEGIGFSRRLKQSGGFYEYVIIDENLFFNNRVKVDTLFASHFDKQVTSIKALVNPFGRINADDIPYAIMEKPLTKSSYSDIISSTPATPLNHDSEVKQHQPTNSYNANVLVVDDNRVNQQVAKEMLKSFDIIADIAEDGRQALRMLLNKTYDLILMDCNMPVLDGYDCTKEIRQLEGSSSIPVIAMTSSTSEEEKEKCKQAGMDSFLAKPLRLSTLNDELFRWLPDRLSHTNLPNLSDTNTKTHAGGENYDAGIIKELFGSLGDVVYPMVEAFIEDTPVYMDSIKNALAADNAKQVRELAHTIKGSAGNFGAHQLVESSDILETLALNDQLSECAPHIEKMVEQFVKLRADMENNVLKIGQDDPINELSAHTLLIVDDDRTLRLALKGVFSGDEFETIDAINGSEAIDLCRRRIPDIILMDAIMPDTHGFTACKAIRDLPHCENIPILIITSLEDEDAIAEAFASGATDYITKPLNFTVLRERVSRLITANKAGKKIKQMAYNDSLTGLPNRARLMQELRVILDRSDLNKKRTAILFIDLDNFKHINDSLGHNVGDLLLKVVADRLRNCIRETDFIARLGGDEFTVILESTEGNEGIAHVAQTICNSLNEPFVFLEKKMFTSASIGISVYPDDAVDLGTLLKHADLAMFKAKENKNQYVFYQTGMADEANLRLELEHDLRNAIHNDQLVLYYQPQYDVAKKTVVAAETLVRWKHPERGLLSPAEFIFIAEQSDLITDLTRWVITDAIRQISIWSKKGVTLNLSVNLSGKDLENTGQLVAFMGELVEQYQIDTSLLELEITESILMADPEQSRQELLNLKDMGFTVAIDDFGTGYSSLNYLKNLPVDKLKIDRVFVQDIDQNSEDEAIVKGIIALADNLNMKTIAEGVETEAQRDILSTLGCPVIQGYLISRPLPLDKFENNYVDSLIKRRRHPNLRVL